MVEALYAALALNDGTFYSHEDIASKVFAELAPNAPKEYVCVLGPKKFEPATRDRLPVLVVAKTLDRDSDPFPMSKAGTVLVSDLTTGELRLRQLFYMPDKVPLPDDDEQAAPPPPPPGYEDVPVAQSSSLDHWWVDLKGTKEIAHGAASVAVAVACGPLVSNFHAISISRKAGEAGSSEYLKALSRKAEAEKEQASYACAKAALSPGVPKEVGFALNPPTRKAEPGKPFVLYGSFNLPSPSAKGDAPVPIHVVLFAPRSTGGSHHELVVPADMMSKQGDSITGYFSVDLMKEFFYRDGRRFDIPTEVHVLVLHKNVSAGPVTVSTGAK